MAQAAEDPGTRWSILDAAAKLFRHQGYSGASLRDVAAAVGMKAGSLYHHFGSKEEIVVEVLNIGVQRVADEVRQAVAALPANAKPEEIITTAIAAHLRALHESGDYTSANVRIFGQLPERVRDGHAEVRLSYEAYWIELLERCRRPKKKGVGKLAPGWDAVLVRNFLLGALNASLEWFDPARGRVEPVAEAMARLVLNGLRGLNGLKGGK
jgi:AcrR family transcriptional regulator